MILDSYSLHSLIVQFRYPNAFELWDRAGAIARRVAAIWPGLELTDADPRQQTLRGNGVQLQTSIDTATVTLRRPKTLDARKIQQIKETFDVWRQSLELENAERVSTRGVYAKDYRSIREANAALFAMNLIRWPTTKVFDQPLDAELNSVDLQYRFEDTNSFSFLRLKSEHVKYEVDLDAEFVDQTEIRGEKCRLVIDFDRGLLGSVSTDKFRMDDWLKGFQHLLRRDLEKVIGSQS
ncbi:hypothetical protein GPA27_20125 [Aromatoleum toluolicum]|uniref:Uncharacterized protein n=1 Tax=Aromatoleum toluolicum TaxID=90060 RepID=A0ABX1NKA1_9RHOO|nr:hypothetical protein [Aromatoleum toluolicum]NMF99689.1 hypothetical protein [Aromatoleum toluolicum]